MSKSTIIASTIVSTITSTIKEMVEDGVSCIDTIASWCLTKLGIKTNVPTGYPEIWHEELFEYDNNYGKFRTWAGKILTQEVHRWDFSGKPLDDDDLISYGDPHYGYQCRVVDRELPLETLIEVHKIIYQELPDLIQSAQAEIVERKKQFGLGKNAELKAAGCSSSEIKAWWSLNWKHEWSAEAWRSLNETLSDEQVGNALCAHSHAYLEACGVSLGSSFPRTMDAIEAIGKSRRLKPKPLAFWNKGLEGFRPQKVQEDGSRIWSF